MMVQPHGGSCPLPPQFTALIQALQNPLGLCWLAWVGTAIFLARRGDRRLAIVAGCACLLLSVFGGTPLAAWVVERLERGVSGGVLPGRADAIVVLGGSYSASPSEPAGFKVSSAFDRVAAGLALMDRGITTNLVLGGGIDPAGRHGIHDSEALRPWLERRLPTTARIHVMESSRTTREEALHFAPLAAREGWGRVILVTSASHVPRAASVFRSHGIPVIPVACAFEGRARLQTTNLWTIVPNTGDLGLAGMWVHEVVGSLYYRLRGWSGELRRQP